MTSHPTHRKRTFGAGALSLLLHVLAALLIGIQMQWRTPRAIRLDDSAIEVTIEVGPDRPMAPHRPPRILSPPLPTESPAPKTGTRKPPAQATPARPRPSAPSQPSAIVSQVAAAIPTESELSPGEDTPLAPSDLMLSEQDSLATVPSEPTGSPPEAPPGEEDAAPEEGERPSLGEQMQAALRRIASHMIAGSGSGRVDVVFLLDTSGSMADNILAVSDQLSDMAAMLEQHGLDYRVGLVKFKFALASLRIFPMTTDVSKFQRVLRNTTRVGGPERAYDALVETIRRIPWRPDVDRHVILVTDEPLSGSFTPSEVWKRCREAQVHVSVIGLDDPFHRKLAEVTGGLWQPIPTD